MKLLAIIFALTLSAQAQPVLQILTGAEHYPGLSGLAGLRPMGSDRRCATIAWINGSRVLAFNLELANIGTQPFDPLSTRPDLVYYDWWSHGAALMGFWRFSLYDTNGTLVARRTQDARWLVFDTLAWDGNASPPFYSWTNPGISPGRVAFAAEEFLAMSYVQLGDFNGPCTLEVTVDPFGAYGVTSSVRVDLEVNRFNVRFR